MRALLLILTLLLTGCATDPAPNGPPPPTPAGGAAPAPSDASAVAPAADAGAAPTSTPLTASAAGRLEDGFEVPIRIAQNDTLLVTSIAYRCPAGETRAPALTIRAAGGREPSLEHSGAATSGHDPKGGEVFGSVKGTYAIPMGEYVLAVAFRWPGEGPGCAATLEARPLGHDAAAVLSTHGTIARANARQTHPITLAEDVTLVEYDVRWRAPSPAAMSRLAVALTHDVEGLPHTPQHFGGTSRGEDEGAVGWIGGAFEADAGDHTLTLRVDMPDTGENLGITYTLVVYAQKA